MTLVQLRHFIMLADCGSYAKASRLLHLTQPALTRSIQSLEEELGQALFDRLGRHIEITTFGSEVLEKARQLVCDADALKQTGRSMQSGLTGSVRIGLSSGPGALLSVPLMLHMAQNHPRLHLELARGHTELLIGALRARRLDGAVVDIRTLRPAADLLVSLKVEMAANFMIRASHPLALLQRPARLSELREYPIASTPLSDEVARMLIQQYGPDANPDDLVTLRCDDIQTLVEVARKSNAIVLTINAAGHDLVWLETDPPMTARARFGLVTLAGRAEAPGLKLVGDFIAQLLAQG
ncbi:MAG: HTH-type transcriptional regulator BenM [Pseudomonadota bacterium]|jgi:DNA-binding transcriptional LysR family regulator